MKLMSDNDYLIFLKIIHSSRKLKQINEKFPNLLHFIKSSTYFTEFINRVLVPRSTLLNMSPIPKCYTQSHIAAILPIIFWAVYFVLSSDQKKKFSNYTRFIFLIFKQLNTTSSLSEYRIFLSYYQLNCSYIRGNFFLFVMFLHTPIKCSFTKVFTEIISAVLICFSPRARTF